MDHRIGGASNRSRPGQIPDRSSDPRAESTARSGRHEGATTRDAFVGHQQPHRADPAAPASPTSATFTGGGVAAGTLRGVLQRAESTIAAIGASPLPANQDELVAAYRALGLACAEVEAALLSALDALDPRTGAGTAQPSEPYSRIKDDAFALLRTAGGVFAKLEPAFAAIVHGPGGWPSQPVVAAPDRGDGRPLVAYENTFKKPPPLALDERRAEYQKRVDKFAGAGGRFEDILTASPGTFDKLQAGLRYDYVLSMDGALRMFPNERDDDKGPPKPGHSLLLVGAPEFRDQRALMAGELWVIKDAAGDVEAVLVANNSGHFKPAFENLDNVLPALEALGVPREKVVLFGGPNNLAAMMTEISEKLAMGDLTSALPPSAKEIQQRLAAEEASGVGALWR